MRLKRRSWQINDIIHWPVSLANQSGNMGTEIYGWFSEDFDTPDLQEAKALLETLL